ncbi:MAG: hypothetical protein QM758_16355 [Armatimonas sp.]
MWNALKKLFSGKSGCDHNNLPPQEENQLAEEIRKQGDLAHAAFHAANAVSSAPTNTEYLATLDRILDIASDPRALFPPDKKGGMAYPQGAALAYVCKRLNRTDEALSLLYSVITARPDIPYLDWAIDWVKDAETCIPTTEFLGRLMQAISNNTLDQQRARPTLERTPQLIDALIATGRISEDGIFYTAAGGLLRRIGYEQKAIEVAQQAYATTPTYWSAVALGSALRESDPRAAIEAFQKATQHDPADVSAWLDIGDLFWNLGDTTAARESYEHVCAREPEHAWAYPSLLALSWDETRSDETQKQLFDFAERATDKNRVMHLCWQRFRSYTGSFLPGPGEALVNFGRGLDPTQITAGDRVEGEVTAPESPSAIAALSSYLARYEAGIDVTFLKIPKPSPLLPQHNVRFALWRYEGHQAVPAVPPPPQAIAEQVAELAQRHFGFIDWLQVARRTTLTEADAEQVAAAMVHPLPPPAGMADWDWTQRTVLAGAYQLVVLDSDLSFELLAGAMDWSVWASALALAAAAQDTPALEQRLLPELQATIRHWDPVTIPEFMHPLYAALVTLSSLDEKTRQAAEKKLQALES